MNRWMRRAAVSAAVFVLAGLMWVAVAGAAVYKNKASGETIRGKMTKQRINKMAVFELEEGGTKFINPGEWECIEQDAPAPEPPPGTVKPDAGGPAETPAEGSDSVTVHIIPINGRIMNYALVDGLEKALKQARLKEAKVVVFRMDTPGGRIDLADKIIQMIQGVDWATTVAWVEGSEKQALSCGAYICLATHQIYMAPGTTIGAATPFRVGGSGAAEVEEKMTSAFRARFRSLAQERGHPSAIADAMVDNSVSVVQVWVDDKHLLVTADEADRLEKEHEGDGKFKRGKIVSKQGKLVTLTSNEALEFEVCRGLAADEKELMEKMGYTQYRINDAKWLPGWIEKHSEARKAEVEKYRTGFNLYFDQAIENDPRRQRYMVNDQFMTFTDGGKRWKEYTDRCLGHLRKCAQALKQIEKIAKDERYDFPVPQEVINDMKTRMESMYARLQNERNARALP